MKRFLAPFVLVLVLFFSACGGSSGGGTSGTGGGGGNLALAKDADSLIACPAGATNASAAPKESGNVTLTVSGWTSSPAEDALNQSNLKKFHQLHPNITVNWSPITGDYETKMRSNIAGGSVPDVFYTTTTMAPQYIPTGKLLNLSPYMARDNVSPDSYYPSLLKPFTCKDGVVYGLVKDWNSLGVFYNKQLFQKAGVPFPSANWTWDDLRADAQKLTKAGNVATSQYGLTLPANASTWGAFLYAAGGSVLNKDGTKATFNSPEGIRSLSFYAGLQRDGYSVMPGQVGAGWGGEAFGKQRVAMDFEGGWAIPFLASTYPNVQYGIAPVPIDSTTDKRGDLIFVNSWGAYAQTQHPEAAWELVKYMTGIDVQTSQLNAGFALPGLQSLADAPYFKSHPDFKVLFDASSYSIPDNYGPHDGVIHQKLAQALESVMLGKSDAQTALNTAARQVDNELQA